MTASDASPPAVSAARTFRQTLLAMLGLCFVLILVALDQTVIGTALPTVVSELHGFDLYAWVGTSYLLTSVVTVPIFGKLGDEHGRKPFVLAGIVLFTGASMLCGAAQSMMHLVLARALQGVGGGMLVATTFACIPDLFPDPKARLRWQILFSTSFGLANAVGPSLGGYLTEYWGWRWVFLVNFPVGLLSLVFVSRYLPGIRHSARAPSPLDGFGALLIALCLGSLQLLVEWWPLHKPAVWLWALGLSSVLSLIALIWWEPRCANPVLPVTMLRNRHLQALFGLSLAMGFCMFAVMYYAPLMFQGGFGLSPNQAGLLITPFAVSITVGSIANGRVITRLYKPNRMLYLGVALFWLAALLLTQTNVSTPHSWIMATMAMGGLGVGTLLPNLTLFTQANAERTQLGVATALLQSTRMVGSMLGTALIGVLVSRRYELGVHRVLTEQGDMRWWPWLRDPQILVDSAQIGRFQSAVEAAGQDAHAMVDAARWGLVSAVHAGQWGVVALMLVVAVLTYCVPPMKLDTTTVTPNPVTE